MQPQHDETILGCVNAYGERERVRACRKLLTVFKGENNVEYNGKPDELGDFLQPAALKGNGKVKGR
ncbi:MAG: hypothetical protein ABFS56_04030 [Pseudomonadota bacterium]